MAIQKPLVIIAGQIQQIPSGDTLSAAAVEVDVVSMTNANAGSITIGMPVYVSVAGSVDKANAAATATKKVLGLVKDASIGTGVPGFIQTDGVLTAATGVWDAIAGTTGGLTANTMYYLGAAAGTLSATPPSGAGQYICEVGLALSATDMDINIEHGGVLLA